MSPTPQPLPEEPAALNIPLTIPPRANPGDEAQEDGAGRQALDRENPSPQARPDCVLIPTVQPVSAPSPPLPPVPAAPPSWQDERSHPTLQPPGSGGTQAEDASPSAADRDSQPPAPPVMD